MKYKITFQKNNQVQSLIFEATSFNELIIKKELPTNIIKIEKLNSYTFTLSVSQEEYYQFFYEFYILLSSNIPILESIETLRLNQYHKNIHLMLEKIYDSLHQGGSIYDALEELSNIPYIVKYFFYVAQKTNNYKQSIESLLHIIKLQSDIKKRFYKALWYPTLLTFAIVFALMILFVYVLPEFEYIFLQSGNNLPTITQVLLKIKAFIFGYGFMILAIFFVGCIYGIWILKKIHRFDKILYIYTPFYQQYLIYNFFLSIKISLESHMQFIESIEFSVNLIQNKYFKNEILLCIDKIKSGTSIDNAFEMSTLFPNKIIRLFRISKYADDFNEIIENLVKIIGEEFSVTIERFSNSIGPILIFFLGGIVLFMVLGILSPIWNVGAVLG